MFWYRRISTRFPFSSSRVVLFYTLIKYWYSLSSSLTFPRENKYQMSSRGYHSTKKWAISWRSSKIRRLIPSGTSVDCSRVSVFCFGCLRHRHDCPCRHVHAYTHVFSSANSFSRIFGNGMKRLRSSFCVFFSVLFSKSYLLFCFSCHSPWYWIFLPQFRTKIMRGRTCSSVSGSGGVIL